MKKIMHTIKITQVILMLLAFNFVSAQVADPVQWSFKTKRLSDTEAELQFIATIDGVWHVYSQFVPEGGPVPTSFKIDKGAGFELVGKVTEPKPHEEMDPNFNMIVKYFSNNVVFTQKIRITTGKPVVVTGILEFMCCDNLMCLPPSEVPFSFNLKGALKPR
jgi:hypothetical protein